jgi:hypothetical protein
MLAMMPGTGRSVADEDEDDTENDHGVRLLPWVNHPRVPREPAAETREQASARHQPHGDGGPMSPLLLEGVFYLLAGVLQA